MLMGISRSSIYQKIREGTIPPPVALGSRSIGWPLSEIVAVNSGRIRGCSAEEICGLVARLVAARRTGA
jgi:prophage regulatory protein